jgi:hypothetical protein
MYLGNFLFRLALLCPAFPRLRAECWSGCDVDGSGRNRQYNTLSPTITTLVHYADSHPLTFPSRPGPLPDQAASSLGSSYTAAARSHASLLDKSKDKAEARIPGVEHKRAGRPLCCCDQFPYLLRALSESSFILLYTSRSCTYRPWRELKCCGEIVDSGVHSLILHFSCTYSDMF